MQWTWSATLHAERPLELSILTQAGFIYFKVLTNVKSFYANDPRPFNGPDLEYLEAPFYLSLLP